MQKLGQGLTKPLREERIGAHRPGAPGMQQSSGTQPSLRTFDYTGEQLAGLGPALQAWTLLEMPGILLQHCYWAEQILITPECPPPPPPPLPCKGSASTLRVLTGDSLSCCQQGLRPRLGC